MTFVVPPPRGCAGVLQSRRYLLSRGPEFFIFSRVRRLDAARHRRDDDGGIEGGEA